MKTGKILAALAGTLTGLAVPLALLNLYAQQPDGIGSMTGNAIANWLLSVIGGIVGIVGSVTGRSVLLWFVTGVFTTQGLIGIFSVSILFIPAALLYALLAIVASRYRRKSSKVAWAWILAGAIGAAIFFFLGSWLIGRI